MINTLAVTLSLFAVILQFSAVVVYNSQIFQAKIKPNPATWFLFVFTTGIIAFSYYAMTGDWIKSIAPFAGFAAALVVFFLAYFKGQFAPLDIYGYSALFLGVITIVVWMLSSSLYANILACLVDAISFAPTIIGVKKDPSRELPLAWWLWTILYIVMTIVVILRFTGNYADFIYPISSIALHGIIAVFSTQGRRVKYRLQNNK